MRHSISYSIQVDTYKYQNNEMEIKTASLRNLFVVYHWGSFYIEWFKCMYWRLPFTFNFNFHMIHFNTIACQKSKINRKISLQQCMPNGCIAEEVLCSY